MGNLAKLLQEEIKRLKPWGMNVKDEFRLFSRDLEKTLGFSPKMDLLLEKQDGSIRYWIEFEISRADPVANHTKFATSCLFQPLTKKEFFISMASRHVARGRNNLGAATIALMRNFGIKAFQTTLLPQFSAGEIKKLNHLPLAELRNIDINPNFELDKIVAITEALGQTHGNRIHFAANPFEVYMNLRNWNLNIQSIPCQDAWKKRTIQYFCFNPWTKQFAPTKFCAYTVFPEKNSQQGRVSKQNQDFFP